MHRRKNQRSENTSYNLKPVQMDESEISNHPLSATNEIIQIHLQSIS